MRNAVFCIVIVLLVVPLALRAADAPKPTPLLPATCANPTQTGNPATIKTFLDTATTDKQIKAFVTNVRSCPSACYDEKIVVSIVNSDAGRGVVYTVTAQDKCKDPTKLPKDQNPPRGCGLKEEPHLTVVTPEIAYDLADGSHYVRQESKTIEDSRCNANADLEAGTSGSATSAGASLPSINTNSSDTKTSGLESEQSKLVSQALQDNLGFSKSEADKAVQTNPNAASGILRAYDAGNAAEIKTRAQELGVTLNPDIQSKITNDLSPGSLSPAEREAASSQLATGERSQVQSRSENTFDTERAATQTGLPAQCGVDGLAGNIMRAESSCARINSNPASSVQGPYHFLCGTWQGYANSTGNSEYADCSYRNNVEISTQVMNAKMDQYAQKYGETCSQAGLTLSSCQYAIHVFGEPGFNKVLAAYQADPSASAFSLCGTAISQQACAGNSSIFRNGGNVAGVFGELDKRLGGNGSVIGSVGNGGSPVGGGMSSIYYIGSPMGYVNPVYGYGNVGTGISVPTGYSTNTSNGQNCDSSGLCYVCPSPGTCYLSNWAGGSANNQQFYPQPAPMSQPAPQTAPASSGVTQSTSVSTGGTGATTGSSVPTGGTTGTAGVVPASGAPAQVPAQAVMSLIVQPQKVSRGDVITASWSSLNMRADVPCQLAMTSTTTISLARSNDGSTKVRAGVSGTLTFTLSCTAATGPAQKSVTVQVQ